LQPGGSEEKIVEMVDLHCHILPGIDDGASTMEDSLAMAESAIEDGITHVIATPHSSSEYYFDFARVRRLRDDLQSRIGDRLQLATGCDFHLNPENLKSLRKDPSPFCLNQRDYLLVEFNEISIPPGMDQTLHEIQLSGVRPIITHPERNRILQAHPERLKKWVRQGCFVQVTGGALTGDFGAVPQKDALQWIREGFVHFVASDAHNTRKRPLRLQPAYDVVVDQLGMEKASALFLDNPLAAFEGRELPHVPEIEEESPPPRRKRFFFF
jgi:protein-tyrosine phosphatase